MNFKQESESKLASECKNFVGIGIGIEINKKLTSSRH